MDAMQFEVIYQVTLLSDLVAWWKTYMIPKGSWNLFSAIFWTLLSVEYPELAE